MPVLRSLTFNFIFVIVFLIVNLGWSLAGMVLIVNSDCSGNLYFSVAMINIGVLLLVFVLLVTVVIYYFVCRRKSAMDVHPNDEMERKESKM